MSETLTAETTTHTPASLRGVGVFMAIAGTIGLTCATILTVEKIHLLQNPQADLSCDISPFVGCGGVVNTPEASAFGIPNTLIGIAAFAVVIALGVLLAAGVTFPRWIFGGLQAGLLFGIGFVTWLQSQSIYDLNLLCPYCMVVWATMIPLFVVGTGACLRVLAPEAALTRIVNDWRALIIALWYVTILALIWFQFGSRLFEG